jgi:hypothetical protein
MMIYFDLFLILSFYAAKIILLFDTFRVIARKYDEAIQKISLSSGLLRSSQ